MGKDVPQQGTTMQQISFEVDDFPVFLRSPAACSRAIERGQLRLDTSIIVYGEAGERIRMIAADHPPLKPMFGLVEPAPAPASPTGDVTEREADATTMTRNTNADFRWGEGTLIPELVATDAPAMPTRPDVTDDRVSSDHKPVAFLDWAVIPYKRYADFAGRARRREYWSFVALTTGIVFSLALMGGFRFSGTAGGLLILFVLASVVPSVAVQIRRLHDRDLSGWLILVGLIPYLGGLIVLVLMMLEGTAGRNRFGPDPRQG